MTVTHSDIGVGQTNCLPFLASKASFWQGGSLITIYVSMFENKIRSLKIKLCSLAHPLLKESSEIFVS